MTARVSRPRQVSQRPFSNPNHHPVAAASGTCRVQYFHPRPLVTCDQAQFQPRALERAVSLRAIDRWSYTATPKAHDAVFRGFQSRRPLSRGSFVIRPFCLLSEVLPHQGRHEAPAQGRSIPDCGEDLQLRLGRGRLRLIRVSEPSASAASYWLHWAIGMSEISSLAH
jgi:hypothetical protein